jgi:CubicO group peptidase (beta-lactamase class C family)
MRQLWQKQVGGMAIAGAIAGMLVGSVGDAGAATKKPAAPAAEGGITVAAPESVGFSSDRLANVHALIQGEVDRKELAGAVTILARHGKVVDFSTYGDRDLATHTPVTKDTIFRIYSMSKPVTGVAMMILYEQGKWLPWDPISKYIPEFAHLKVFAGVDAAGKPILVEPEHAPTMGELMSHSAGFSYGAGKTVVDKMYQDAGVMHSENLQQMVDKLAKIPLNYQPGRGWTYSASMDIEGYIIEKLSGQTLPVFMREHIFAPLAMKDTGFYVPAAERSRFATNYEDNDQEQLVPAQKSAGASTDYLTEPTMPSGGGGLVSTIGDYFRFAEMLAHGGELDGKRILSPASVKLMTSNHLRPEQLTGQFGIGQSIMRPGFGYGFNCAVIFDPATAEMADGKGTFFWDGAAGTWFWVDPTNDVVFVSMIQRMHGNDNHTLEYRSHATVYGALVDPAK